MENPQGPLSFPAEWLLRIFNGGRTDSGIRVSEITALQVGTVYACVNIISNGVSGLPFHVYERLFKSHRQGKRLAVSHILWDLLHSEPNPEIASILCLRSWFMGCCGAIHTRKYSVTATTRLRQYGPAILHVRGPCGLHRPLSIEGTVWPVGTLIFETTRKPDGNSFHRLRKTRAYISGKSGSYWPRICCTFPA